jgi:FkbM family methyltransferase
MTTRGIIRRYAFLSPRLYELQQFCRSRARSLLKPDVHDCDFLYFRRWAGRPATFLDIGANVGQSVASIHNLVPQAHICSFEPNGECYRQVKILAKLLGHVETFNCALGAAPGMFTFHIPKARGFAFSQLASLNEPNREELAADLVERGFSFATAANLEIERRQVEVRTLDSFNLRPDVIKIDVEGAELDVLRGGQNTLAQSRPTLLIEEGGRPEIQQALSSLDYLPFSYDAHSDRLVGPRKEGWNLFYVPRDNAGPHVPRTGAPRLAAI